MFHKAFRDVILMEEATWYALVLITNGGRDYLIIGLVEVVWKAL